VPWDRPEDHKKKQEGNIKKENSLPLVRAEEPVDVIRLFAKKNFKIPGDQGLREDNSLIRVLGLNWERGRGGRDHFCPHTTLHVSTFKEGREEGKRGGATHVALQSEDWTNVKGCREKEGFKKKVLGWELSINELFGRPKKRARSLNHRRLPGGKLKGSVRSYEKREKNKGSNIGAIGGPPRGEKETKEGGTPTKGMGCSPVKRGA